MDAALITIPSASILTPSLVDTGFATLVSPSERWKTSATPKALVDLIDLPTDVHVRNSGEKGLESKLRTRGGLVYGNLSGTV